MQWVPHLSFVPFNSHLKEKADANLEQRPHLAEVRCFASISNPSQRPGRVLPWCGVSCWSFYINLALKSFCVLFSCCFSSGCVPLQCIVSNEAELTIVLPGSTLIHISKTVFFGNSHVLNWKGAACLPWSESISSFDLNVSAAAARDKCGVFENFFAFLSFQYDSPSSHTQFTHTNSQISTSYVQHLCICFRGEQSQSCLYVGYGKIYFCNGTLSVLIGAFSWQRDTICIMQGSISNCPCIGSAANLSSLWDWGGGRGYEI